MFCYCNSQHVKSIVQYMQLHLSQELINNDEGTGNNPLMCSDHIIQDSEKPLRYVGFHTIPSKIMQISSPWKPCMLHSSSLSSGLPLQQPLHMFLRLINDLVTSPAPLDPILPMIPAGWKMMSISPSCHQKQL